MLLAKYSEPLLKAEATRRRMERVLRRNILALLRNSKADGAKLRLGGGLVMVDAEDEAQLLPLLLHIFGIEAVSVCDEVELEMNKVRAKCAEAAANFVSGSSFAIRAKRSAKFPLSSQQVGAECGEAVLDAHPEKKLKVNLDSPQNEIFVDVREKSALVCKAPLRGPGGLPTGSEGRAACIIHDGIFSPLAAWMVAKRGMEPVLLCQDAKIGEQAAEKLGPWLSGVQPQVISCKSLQNACEEAMKAHASALVVGDFLDEPPSGETSCGLPVFRPLIGLGRDEALAMAARAGFVGKGAKA